jgi:hypothetical protein
VNNRDFSFSSSAILLLGIKRHIDEVYAVYEKVAASTAKDCHRENTPKLSLVRKIVRILINANTNNFDKIEETVAAVTCLPNLFRNVFSVAF